MNVVKILSHAQYEKTCAQLAESAGGDSGREEESVRGDQNSSSLVRLQQFMNIFATSYSLVGHTKHIVSGSTAARCVQWCMDRPGNAMCTTTCTQCRSK